MWAEELAERLLGRMGLQGKILLSDLHRYRCNHNTKCLHPQNSQTNRRKQRRLRPESINYTGLSEQELVDMYGTVAELFSGQRDCLPFRAAAFHELAVIIQLDVKEQVLVRVEIEIIPAVKIDVDILGFVCKNKCSLMILAKNPLPSCQALDISDCDPALEASQFGQAGAFEFSALYFGDDDWLAGRV